MNRKFDIHNYDRRYENAKKGIEKAEISKKKNQRMLDRVVPVLIEGVMPETDSLLRGRAASMAPDVDGQVLINRGQAAEGEIVPVLMKEANTYDLIGEIVQ